MWAEFIPAVITNTSTLNISRQISFELSVVNQIINSVFEFKDPGDLQDCHVKRKILNLKQLYFGAECEFEIDKPSIPYISSEIDALSLWESIVLEKASTNKCRSSNRIYSN